MKPKFEIGDEVYCVYNNKVMKFFITGIWIHKGRSDFFYQLTTHLDYEDEALLINESGAPTRHGVVDVRGVKEDRLFKTKEELIKSL